jgi:hypothetical protein
MEKKVKIIFIVAMAIALAYQTYQVHKLSQMAERCEIRKGK